VQHGSMRPPLLASACTDNCSRIAQCSCCRWSNNTPDITPPSGSNEVAVRFACAGAGYTAVDPESRRIVPTDAERQGKTVVKMVYVVLEAQYQVGWTFGLQSGPHKTQQGGGAPWH
jgi:hypothetical protein